MYQPLSLRQKTWLHSSFSPQWQLQSRNLHLSLPSVFLDFYCVCTYLQMMYCLVLHVLKLYIYKCHLLYVSLCNFFGCFCSILYFWDVSTSRPLSLIHSFSLLCSIPLAVNITVFICLPGDKHLDWGSRISLSTTDFQEADTKMESDVQEMNWRDTGEWCGSGRRSRQGEPSDHKAGLTQERRVGRKEDWVRKTSD